MHDQLGEMWYNTWQDDPGNSVNTCGQIYSMNGGMLSPGHSSHCKLGVYQRSRLAGHVMTEGPHSLYGGCKMMGEGCPLQFPLGHPPNPF